MSDIAAIIEQGKKLEAERTRDLAHTQLVADLDFIAFCGTHLGLLLAELSEARARIERVEAEVVACEEMARESGGDVSMETVARWFRAALRGTAESEEQR